MAALTTIAIIAAVAAAAGTGAYSAYQASQTPEVPEPPIPKEPEALKPPTTETAGVQEAVAEAARRRQRSRGYRSTILRSMSEQGGGLQQTFGS